MPTIHPIVAAKQCTTIDHLTGGRFALNVVCGWYSQELRMFGLPPMDHDTRYAYADEWVEVVRKLWTAEGGIRLRGPLLQNREGLSPAETGAATADHERRQLRHWRPFCRQAG